MSYNANFRPTLKYANYLIICVLDKFTTWSVDLANI